MKQLLFTALLVFFLFNFPLHGGEGEKQLSTKELTEPEASSSGPFHYPENREEVITLLDGFLDAPVVRQEIKQFRQISYAKSDITNAKRPLLEITMISGKVYLYSPIVDVLFAVEMRLPRLKRVHGVRSDEYAKLSYKKYLTDTINEQLVVLEEIPRKKIKRRI